MLQLDSLERTNQVRVCIKWQATLTEYWSDRQIPREIEILLWCCIIRGWESRVCLEESVYSPHMITERCRRVGATPAPLSSGSGDRMSWLGFSVVLFSHFTQMPVRYFKFCQAAPLDIRSDSHLPINAVWPHLLTAALNKPRTYKQTNKQINVEIQVAM